MCSGVCLKPLPTGHEHRGAVPGRHSQPTALAGSCGWSWAAVHSSWSTVGRALTSSRSRSWFRRVSSVSHTLPSYSCKSQRTFLCQPNSQPMCGLRGLGCRKPSCVFLSLDTPWRGACARQGNWCVWSQLFLFWTISQPLQPGLGPELGGRTGNWGH